MYRAFFTSVLLLCFVSTASATADVLWYNGDVSDLHVSEQDYGRTEPSYQSWYIYTFEDVTVPVGQSWNVDTIYGNYWFNPSYLPENNQQAAWQIRTGVSEGNGGSLYDNHGDGPVGIGSAVYSFASNGLSLDTGGYKGYTLSVDLSSLNITLTPGTYYILLAPYGAYPGLPSVALTDGTHGVNALIDSTIYQNAPYANWNYVKAGYDISMGITGSVPEPASALIVLCGVMAAAGLARRRRRDHPDFV